VAEAKQICNSFSDKGFGQNIQPSTPLKVLKDVNNRINFCIYYGNTSVLFFYMSPFTSGRRYVTRHHNEYLPRD
jgi:hypothetical protein